jgi:hypothetical protein
MGPNKLKYAAIGGAAAGVLSALPIVNNCCCIWGILGGFLAAYLLSKDTGGISPGDGTTVGAMAGAVGAVIYLVLGLPINYLVASGQIEQALAQSNVELPFSGGVLIVVVTLIAAVVIAGLGAVGGVIAGLIFKPKVGPGGPGTPGAPPAAPYGQPY